MSEAFIETHLLLERVIRDFQEDQAINTPGLPTLISSDAALCSAAEGVGGQVISPSQATPEYFGSERMPVAIVDAMAEFTAPQQAITLISQLRDIYAMQVLVIAQGTNAPLDRATLTSLGFHRWQSSLHAADKRTWFIFDLAHYKVTPDWLNPKHWANPELWDKYRW